MSFLKSAQMLKVRQYLLPDRLALQKLIDGEIDLMIVPNPIFDERIEWVPLFKEAIFLVFPKNHPLAAKEKFHLLKLKMKCLFLSETGQSFRATENRIFENAGFTPSIAFEGEELSVILQLVNEGTGISFIFKNSFFRHLFRQCKDIKDFKSSLLSNSRYCME